MAPPRKTLSEQFWPKVDKNGPMPDASDPLVSTLSRCWAWVGAKTTQGYGTIERDGKLILAHRASLQLHGLALGENTDHLCRNKLCVNPEHLESVTIRENSARGNAPSAIALRTGMCKNGHALTGWNVRENRKPGWRRCRTCSAKNTSIYRAKLRDSKLNTEELLTLGRL